MDGLRYKNWGREKIFSQKRLGRERGSDQRGVDKDVGNTLDQRQNKWWNLKIKIEKKLF